MNNEIDIPLPVDFSLFSREGGFITFTAPSEIVSKSFVNGDVPPVGTEIKMIISSKETNTDGVTTIKIMLEKK